MPKHCVGLRRNCREFKDLEYKETRNNTPTANIALILASMARYWRGCFPRDATKGLARAHTHAEQEAIVWPVRGDVLVTSIRARANNEH
jgi:hypothetical protein